MHPSFVVFMAIRFLFILYRGCFDSKAYAFGNCGWFTGPMATTPIAVAFGSSSASPNDQLISLAWLHPVKWDNMG